MKRSVEGRKRMQRTDLKFRRFRAKGGAEFIGFRV